MRTLNLAELRVWEIRFSNFKLLNSNKCKQVTENCDIYYFQSLCTNTVNLLKWVVVVDYCGITLITIFT